jgi:hypothetical protein
LIAANLLKPLRLCFGDAITLSVDTHPKGRNGRREGKYSVLIPDAEFWKQMVPCQAACPVHTDAGRYVQLIAIGEYREAYLTARPPNPFASDCGRVCAAPC